MSLDKCFEDVKSFHEAFNHPTSTYHKMSDEDRKQKRIKWMIEEISEFDDAKTIEDQADALIDLIYFAVGTFVEMGINPSAIWDIVQDANMAKIFPDGKPHYNNEGKVIKPEGWKDPQPLIKKYIERENNDESFR